MDICKLLKHAIEVKASDIRLNTNCHPIIRVDGALRTLINEEILTAQCLRELFDCITTEKQKQALQAKLQLDFVDVIPEVGRFRVNCFNPTRGPEFLFSRDCQRYHPALINGFT